MPGRVLWVVHYPHYGGPHNEALRMREALARRGWEIVMAVPDEPGSAAPRLREAGVETLQLPLARLRASLDPRLLLRYLRELRSTVRVLEQAIERTGATVVVVGGLVNPHAALAARRRGAAVVWQIVDSRAPALIRRLAMPIVRRYADSVLFDGETLVGLHGGRERLGVAAFVYLPPVDTGRFVPSPDRGMRVRAELGILPDVPVVGTVSVLTPMKGLEIFLDAATRITAARPDTRFVVVGSAPESHGEYAAGLRRRAEELRLPHPVVFAGERADVESWYPAFDVHVITSLPRSEGTTTTALEAQSCGVPVVAARVAAVPEVVEDGVAGVLVEPERPDLVAEAVLGLLDDEALRSRLGSAGRTAALARFGVESCADVHARAYEAALEHAAARSSGR
jgi:glycosyltransferase involved in cell wall biosynthesis